MLQDSLHVALKVQERKPGDIQVVLFTVDDEALGVVGEFPTLDDLLVMGPDDLGDPGIVELRGGSDHQRFGPMSNRAARVGLTIR